MAKVHFIRDWVEYETYMFETKENTPPYRGEDTPFVDVPDEIVKRWEAIEEQYFAMKEEVKTWYEKTRDLTS